MLPTLGRLLGRARAIAMTMALFVCVTPCHGAAQSIRVCISAGRTTAAIGSTIGMVLTGDGLPVAKQLGRYGVAAFRWDGSHLVVRLLPVSAAGDTLYDTASGSSISAAPGPTVTAAPDDGTRLAAQPTLDPVLRVQEFTASGPVVIVPTAPGNLALSGTPYRGAIEITAGSSGLVVVNQLPLEQYLYGVVPGEMYPNWEPEALRAQAVAARTYAIRNMLRHASDDYNLCATTHCQVYRGLAAETARTTQAVDDTSGIVATYGGHLIDAQFHSSSGGMTEDPSIVWGGSVPYLKPVASPEVGCPYSSWSIEMQAADVAAKLAKAGMGVGTVLEILPTSVGASGRLADALIRGAMGSVQVRGEKLRAALGLNSSLFYVEPILASVAGAGTSPSTPDAAPPFTAVVPALGFRFVGRGFGHGVGMSQWGAQTMAQRGASFSEILRHYYSGIELEQWVAQ